MPATNASATPAKEVDVIIIGAGLSGIGAACHLRRESPNKTFTILERRESMGGTWDLFKYPGIRSDSDMFTLGYNFKPWTGEKFLADGPSIKKYIEEAAAEHDVERHIKYGVKVLSGNWDSSEKKWTGVVLNEATGEQEVYKSRFVIGCAGYYNYDQGYTPNFPEIEKFKGQVVHPQQWPEDLDYEGKKVVVIGSGATAVTLIPAMADKTEHITMLQRSPTYVASVPDIDPMVQKMRDILPDEAVYKLGRARNISFQRMMWKFAKSQPDTLRKFLLKQVEKQVGPEVDMKHFTPRYNPWDERLCAVPRGDLFKSIRAGKASVETDQIEKFTATGIRLKSGKLLKADIVITATGLNLQLMGGIQLSVDNKPVDPSERLVYRSCMLADVPNLVMVIGYTNSSWTLKSDQVQEYFCRLVNYMDKVGAKVALPSGEGEMPAEGNIFDMQSGYVKRAEHLLPRQGQSAPWKVVHNYFYDLRNFKTRKINDGVMQFDAEEQQSAFHMPKFVSRWLPI